MTESDADTSYQMRRTKIIFTGDAGVGKTSIINAIMGQKFSPDYEPSIGVDFFSKTLRYKENLIKLQIWDSAGQEKFRSLIPNYIRGSSLIFLVFEVTKKESFQHLNDWINFINSIDNGNIVLIGNKIDLADKREVDKNEIDKFCQDNHFEYFEVSAKNGTNINNCLYSSVAGLPIFNVLNKRNESKEVVIENLVKENLESLRYESSLGENIDKNKNSNNNSNDNNQVNLNELNINKSETNKSELLNPNNKKNKFCHC